MRLSALVCIATALLISACHAKPFQPPPADVEMWQKPGGNKDDVRQAMTACGYPNYSGMDGKATTEQQAERFECMKHAGLVRTDGFDLCTTLRAQKIMACQPHN
ncbi:MAG: hypothetical protein PW845_27190 [Pseudomonas sp.]|uniref:hypothetical protein n=1 Tax=Pseudomonas abieticivorans TaxID=2931382 RepID=UPI0020C02032|nr:hypothetical protein [Pseudomonas sp. PIA16]MDE1168968.1 hypothetical protein [Pseudomonas sp.]